MNATIHPPRNSGRNLRLWAAATACILTVPFIAMFFTNEVQWSPFDFAFAGTVIFGLGALFEMASRLAGINGPYRWGAGITLTTLFLTIWFQGAVGIIGDEGDPIGLFFLGVIAAVIGTGVLSRFRAKGLSTGLLLIAGAQAALAIGTTIAGYDREGSIITLVMAGMWAVAGLLFRGAAKGATEPGQITAK